MKDKVIHSSLAEVVRLGTNSEFPGYPDKIGAIVRLGTRGAVISYHQPKLTSLVEGETVSLEDTPDINSAVDTELRSSFDTMASMCRDLAAYLISQAERLESLVTQEVLVHNSESRESILLDQSEHSMPTIPTSKIDASLDNSVPVNLDLFED